MKQLNKLFLILIAVTSLTACRKYFDVNSDPTSPQSPDLAALLPPVLANSGFHHANEGLNVHQLVQNVTNNTGGAAQNIHAGNAGGASTTSFWRTFYVTMGTSLNLIIDKGIVEENWDYVGVGYALKAWGFQQATDYFGELPFHGAWKSNQATFKYDTQEDVYKGIDSLLRTALFYLNRTDGKVSQTSLGRGDNVFKGNRSLWIKFVHGMMARRFNRLTNKSTYTSDALYDSVIKYVNLSFADTKENFMIPFSGSKSDDANQFGPGLNRFSAVKKSRFITQLLDGTILHGTHTPTTFTAGTTIPANRDPRLFAMLTRSKDSTTVSTNNPTNNGGYRFNILNSTGASTTAEVETLADRRPSIVYFDTIPSNTFASAYDDKIGHYIFKNKAPQTLMAYHELQFIKAEAAHRKGNKALAHEAYVKGIEGHMDFVNFYATFGPSSPQVNATQRAAYLQSAAVRQNPSQLTLTDIMLQKYIGDWAWNPYETWADLRRYHYFDLDPETGVQVYQTFAIPFYSINNLGPKPAYRFLPTTVSEFDWNETELIKIGAFNQDYHTYEMWFSQP